MFLNHSKLVFRSTNLVLALVLFSTVGACSRPQNIVVEERVTVASAPVRIQRGNEYERRDNAIGAERRGPAHTVQANDTLYSIAFSHQLSVADLMCWNAIRDSRRLQVGQTLTLLAPNPAPQCASDVVIASSTQRQQGATVSKPRPQSTRVPVKQAVAPTQLSWAWPLKGELLERYSAPARRQGIVIAAPLRAPIKAAANGTVVYRGNALKGYGNLLILNHANGYLSAYAHTQEILVKEGQAVRMNDVIAIAGRDAANRTALHFQIRKDGNPIDPLPLLN